jgi:hypothetical protein
MSLVCAECDREPREDENAEDDRCVYSDGSGELLTFCPECAEREFRRDNASTGRVAKTQGNPKVGPR